MTRIVVDPVAEVGVVQASWTDEHGDWEVLQTQFIHPDHLSGVRLGPSSSLLEAIDGSPHPPTACVHTDAGAPPHTLTLREPR